MQTWAKRGLQTALVTGGLLMLGTGIASADENVNPDTPASPLDLNVTVPIQADNNAIGTPLGQVDVPGYQGEVSTKPVTSAVKDALASAKSPGGAASKLTGSLPKADAPRQLTPTHDALKGNKVSGDLVVPIQIVDNAVGVLGDAKVDGKSHDQTYSHNQDIATSGENSGLAGNVVALDWALPVQLAGNGVGVAGGSGAVHGGSASQSATETGNIDTNGKGSGLSGNVVAGQFATPVQVTGNAASWILGNAYSEYTADSSATSGGSMLTDGEGGAGTGNVVGAPIALPVKFNGNAGGAWGSDADTKSNSSADAKAGDERPGSLGIPTYAETNGDKSFLGGNAAAAQLSPIANVASVAASWIGNASTGGALDREAGGSTSSTVDSGGFIKTSAEKSAGAGNVVDPAVALPVDVCGVGGTYIGNSHAACDNTVDANAGDGSYTRGNDGFLGANIVNTQVAGAPEVYGIGGSHIGNASGTATEDKVVTAGGYDGSQGTNSSGSGNIVQVPVGVPAEVFGVGGSFIGQGSAQADETKVVQGGGGGNTADDNGFLSSNLGTVPVSTPVQVFGIGGAFVGQGHGNASTDTTSGAGWDVNATGKKGAGAGNIVEAPVSLPAQVHGIGGALAGIGTGQADNLTDSTAGGNASSDGQEGGLAGNIIKAPVAGSVSPSGSGVAGAALGHGGGSNDVASTAGGSALTNGDAGAIAGNIVGADPLATVPVVADAVSAAGVASAKGPNSQAVTNAGDDTTSGVEGSVSGNILDLPVTAVPYVVNNAVAVAGVSHAMGDNTITATNGGTPTTDGDGSALSGYNFYHHLPVVVPIFGVELPLFGTATTDGTDNTTVSEPSIDTPLGSELAADQLPALPSMAALPTPGALPGLRDAGALPGLPAMAMLPGTQRADLPVSGLSALNELNQLKGAAALPTVSGLGNGVHLPGLPGGERADAPALPQLPAQLPVKANLPTLQQLPAVTALPALPGVPATLPTSGVPALPTAGVPALPQAPAVPALPTAQVPALAGMDSSPLGAIQKLAAKVTGMFKK
ncbi:PE-PGRS family protein [Amycolatopsis sp. FDAARGOS 1241]|uniref:beta strand repeat-containing protein n=1 Tax=Amycolatopsis sp. FDAARGOS 1241 TaxID=2778070 RepID=UPI00194E7900|nr:PE-PGRS family protein [Amycolatopsis sp. FDAARGOS 1241]QRP46105.1 PE-PGRS family protein [Amycolatopsis sp. FDAARGOS 1241]